MLIFSGKRRVFALGTDSFWKEWMCRGSLVR